MHESFPGFLIETTLDSSLPTVFLRLGLALAAGYAVAWLATFRQRKREDDTLPITLVLMSVLIAMATQIIGDNIARAFSLVGALSIVRFRTAVPQTQDVAFVLTSVVVGMAIGAGQYAVATIGLVVVGMIVALTGQLPSRQKVDEQAEDNPTGQELELVLVVGPSAVEAVQQTIGTTSMCETHQLRSVETARRGAALKLLYRIKLAPNVDPIAVVSKLQQLSAVESVEARR